MKLRIIKNGNNIFHVQMKSHFFGDWCAISAPDYSSEEDANKCLEDIYFDKKRRMEDQKLKKKIKVIKTVRI